MSNASAPPPVPVSLVDVRDALRDFAAARDWDQYHTPRNLLLALTGEVGELAELFQWRGEVRPGLPEFTAADRARVGEEMADVLMYLVRMADRCDVDLGAAFQDKIVKNNIKYPADRAKGKSEKYTAYEAAAAAETASAVGVGADTAANRGSGGGDDDDSASVKK